ncbi:PaaI family thioesterase [Schaalia vaccimaxillae]|uniref:PaaI family thioesterase n=1 Tax=Schaalia vaccimaxillae TaxID=183916 RepID=UPI0003B33ABE|nr:PaaI family thioesterase [Schaalia vaccimaxillae]
MTDADRMNRDPISSDPPSSHRDNADLGQEFDSRTLMSRMGMKLVEVDPTRTVVSMPVAGNTQPAGFLHGGASAALVETAASLAASQHGLQLRPDAPLVAVGTELSISHVASARDGCIRATTSAVHLGLSSTVHTVEVTDEKNRLIATARVTNRLLDPRR